jgi:hypothetical protein
MDMVRSMLSYFTLPIDLLMELLKTIIHILNRVPSKSVSKISYELWTGHKLLLNYLYVWDCPVKAKIFNSNIVKLESKTVSCHFIGCPKKSKAFRFYCSDRYTKFVETRHTVFLKDEMMRGRTMPREMSLKEKRVYVPTHMIYELIHPEPVHEHTIPTFKVGSLSTAPNVNEVPVIQEAEVPNAVIDEEEDQPQNLENNVPNQENIRRS